MNLTPTERVLEILKPPTPQEQAELDALVDFLLTDQTPGVFAPKPARSHVGTAHRQTQKGH